VPFFLFLFFLSVQIYVQFRQNDGGQKIATTAKKHFAPSSQHAVVNKEKWMIINAS